MKPPFIIFLRPGGERNRQWHGLEVKWLLPIALAAAAFAQPAPTPTPVAGLGPFRDSSNFAWDLYGQADTRAGTWGFAEVQTGTITFAAPPAGYQVHILKLSGDFIAWIRSLPGDAVTPAESAAGVLIAYGTGVPIGSSGFFLRLVCHTRAALSASGCDGLATLHADHL